MDLTQIAVAAVGPLVTALVAGVLVAVRDWQDRRRQQQDQAHALQRLRDQTEALGAWLSTHAQVQDIDPEGGARRAAVVEDLSRLQVRLRDELTRTPVRTAGWSPVDSLKTLFLVGQRGRGALVTRVLFYLYLPFLALLISLVIPTALASSTSPAAQSITAATSVLLVTLPAIVLWAASRTWARRAGRRAASRPSAVVRSRLGAQPQDHGLARAAQPRAAQSPSMPEQSWR